MDASIVKQAAQNQWTYILPTLGVSAEHLSNVHGPCPVCGGKDRFRFDDKDGHGTWFCNHCDPQAGDALALLRNVHGWSFPEVLKRVSDVLSLSNNSPGRRESNVYKLRRIEPAKPVFDRERYHAMVKLWESGVAITEGDPAGLYLTRERGIELSGFPKALRFTESSNPDLSICHPALIAAYTNSAGELVQVQKILLTKQGRKATDVAKLFMPKWRDGAMRGSAVKLYKPGEVLAIAEGIETALAYYSQFKIPVWATGMASLMPQVVIPETVREVIVLADNDESQTGINAAKSLADRVSKQGRTFKILLPDQPGIDFADLFSKSKTA